MKEFREDESLGREVTSNPNNASLDDLTDNEKIDIVARRILERYKKAFIELAK